MFAALKSTAGRLREAVQDAVEGQWSSRASAIAPGNVMVWSLSNIPIDLASRLEGFVCWPVIAAVGEYVYVFGYSKMPPGHVDFVHVHVLILHSKTLSWEEIPFPSTTHAESDCEFAPKNTTFYFAESFDRKVYVGTASDVVYYGEIYVFDTENLRWSLLRPADRKGYGRIWNVPTCMHEGQLFMLSDNEYFENDRMTGCMWGFYLWRLDLTTLQWKIVTRHINEFNFQKQWIFPYNSRIYILNRGSKGCEETMWYFDLASDTWGSIQWSGSAPDPRKEWFPFVQGQHLYILVSESLPLISTRFGERKSYKAVVRYSFASDKYEKVLFKRTVPSHSLSCVIGVKNVIIFFSFKNKEVYVLDFDPTLRSMCLQAITKYGLNSSDLPQALRKELAMYRC